MVNVVVKIGDEIYVPTNDDIVGGKAHVTKVYKQKSGGKMTLFIEVDINPAGSFNWGQELSRQQRELRLQFGDSFAHPHR
jgi:hypothetical protein